jgi:cytochrome d ubiquinol oxidase subunit I
MQTPAGHEIVDGEFHVRSWFEVVFNPSFPYRFSHMLLASALTVAFLLSGISAWQVLRECANRSTPKVLRVGLTLAAVLIPLQIAVGDMHGLNTLVHQPQKIAAIEGVWNTERGAPLLLFALPDDQARANHFEIAIPKLASLILTHDAEGEIKGLNEFRDRHPPALPLFFAFRVMVGMGMLMLLTSWPAWCLCRRAGWQPARLPRWLLQVLAGMTFSGWVATLAGWYVTEIGRQPFIVFGLLRTADVASSVAAPMIALTLAMYIAMYLALITAYMAVLGYMAQKGEPPHDESRAPSAQGAPP